ncbi:hypothetical protein BJ322DRAFT_1075075 [Thelephora terrestris]|uniref:PCI domain-containing protein n=1 Tax=Thelephora terrestris TaxID=56493 RepID=A0A9P6L4P4_9AGAM|nr:hypothetical protein BJ322DRAFT_1075075 [Thelephora terrestris]
MPVTFTNYLEQISHNLDAHDGPRLAYLLRVTGPHVKDLLREFKNPTLQGLSRYQGAIESPWDEIAIRYVLIAHHIAKRRPNEAFKEHTAFINLFYRFLSTTSGWTLPALFAVLRDLKDLAFDADNETQSMTCTEEAARVASKALTTCITDRTSQPAESRRWGVYYVTGLIMKLYFRVKRISLSKNILRAIDANPDIPPLSQYPRSHQVTHRYYIGMLDFLNDNLAKAEQELTFAFYNCHLQMRRNQERILTYLIPLRMLRGHLPSSELLGRFPDLDRLYSPFVAAVRKGGIKEFDTALDRAERKLLELNVLLALEKSRELCLRGVFRRAWISSSKGNRMPIRVFHAALAVSGVELPVEEVECLLANQIYKGFMKGYISHEKQMVVLSNVKAFPKLTERANPFATL